MTLFMFLQWKKILHSPPDPLFPQPDPTSRTPRSPPDPPKMPPKYPQDTPRSPSYSLFLSFSFSVFLLRFMEPWKNWARLPCHWGKHKKGPFRTWIFVVPDWGQAGTLNRTRLPKMSQHGGNLGACKGVISKGSPSTYFYSA